jgi:transcriptional/translational regulatory protein YebC/TACO1
MRLRPAGVAILIETLTDKKVRTVSEIRQFSRKTAAISANRLCEWMFEKKGTIFVERSAADEDTLMTIVLEAGAEDMKSDPDDDFEIITAPEMFEPVKAALTANISQSHHPKLRWCQKLPCRLKEQPQPAAPADDALEDNDDVQNVYANFDMQDQE